MRVLHFLFTESKFLVGDKVQVNGRPMIVEDILIEYTVFRVEDHILLRIPNVFLMTMEILNLTRNPDAARNGTSTAWRNTSNVVRIAAAA